MSEPSETDWYRRFWRLNAVAWIVVELAQVGLLLLIWQTLRHAPTRL